MPKEQKSELLEIALWETYERISSCKLLHKVSKLDVGWMGRDLYIALSDEDWKRYDDILSKNGFDVSYRTNSNDLILARIITWQPDRLILYNIRFLAISIIIYRF